MLNLEWLRTFKAIYETGTLSAAAEALHISQPGVSLHLKSLESYTGYNLFERETRRMIPTERGILFYNYINEALQKLSEAEQLFYKRSKGEKMTISVGMCYEMFQYGLEEHVAQLPFNLVVRFGEYPQMLRDLEAGALDLVLTSQRGQQPNVAYTPVTTEQIVLICGSKTDTEPLNQFIQANDTVAIQDWLSTQIWYTTAAEMEHLKNFWTINFGSIPDFRPNYILPYFSSIMRSLKNGNGFAVIPSFLCQQEIKNGWIRLAWEGNTRLENTLYFGKQKKTVSTSELQQLQKILTDNFNA